MFNLFKKKPKKIELYAVVPNVSKDEPGFDFFTITETKAQSQEYIYRRLFIENKEHYTRWCDLREIDYKDKNNWALYIASTGNVPMDKYFITKIKYTIEDVATIFRLYNKCVPIGTSYEDEFEVNQFIEEMTKNALDNIAEKVKEEKLDK